MDNTSSIGGAVTKPLAFYLYMTLVVGFPATIFRPSHVRGESQRSIENCGFSSGTPVFFHGECRLSGA